MAQWSSPLEFNPWYPPLPPKKKNLDKENNTTLNSVLWALNVYKCLVSHIDILVASRAKKEREQKRYCGLHLKGTAEVHSRENRACVIPWAQRLSSKFRSKITSDRKLNAQMRLDIVNVWWFYDFSLEKLKFFFLTSEIEEAGNRLGSK